LKIEADIETGDPVSWSITFSTNGPWTNVSSGEMAMRPEGAEAEPGAEGQPHAQGQPATNGVGQEQIAAMVKQELEATKATLVQDVASQVMVGLRELLPSLLAAREPHLAQAG
jgi:hypothetical protein